MEVETITMDPEVAKRKLLAYRGHLGRRSDQRYEAAIAGYKALANGTPLIDIEQVIRAGGTDEEGRPRLAIARADRRQVSVCREWRTSSRVIFTTRERWAMDDRFPELAIQVDLGGPPTPRANGYALVPMVPADVRPARGNLRQWFILWEVQQWSDHVLGAQPDRDPFLLKHLGGMLYAVIGEWELTDLERAVMREAIRS